MKIGLCGPPGAGKTTIAKLLGPPTYAFADPLKALASEFGYDENEKEKWRELLWDLSRVMNGWDPTYLLRKMEPKLTRDEWVVHDLRFPVEVDLIRSRGGIVVWIAGERQAEGSIRDYDGQVSPEEKTPIESAQEVRELWRSIKS